MTEDALLKRLVIMDAGIRPWSSVLDDIIDTDLNEEFDAEFDSRRSNKPIEDINVPARGPGGGYRDPGYYIDAYQWAKERGIMVFDIRH